MIARFLQLTTGLLLSIALAGLVCCAAPPANAWLGVSVPQEQSSVHYVDEDTSLVVEERLLDLEEGTNPVFVNFEGINIVAGSLRLDFVGVEHAPVLLRVTTRHSRSGEAVWLVHAPQEGNYPVMISYLSRGLRMNTRYRAYVAESTINLHGRAIVENNSGQSFADIVLTAAGGHTWKAITLLPGEKKELPFRASLTCPAERLYVYDTREYGGEVMLLYKLTAAVASGLPGGRIQLYRREAEADLVFLGEDRIDWTNPGEQALILVGNAQDVLLEEDLVSFSRQNVRRDNRGRIQVYDTSERYRIVVTNRRESAATVQIRKHVAAPWYMVSAHSEEYVREDAHSFSFTINLQPDERRTIEYHLARENVLAREDIQPLAQ